MFSRRCAFFLVEEGIELTLPLVKEETKFFEQYNKLRP